MRYGSYQVLLGICAHRIRPRTCRCSIAWVHRSVPVWRAAANNNGVGHLARVARWAGMLHIHKFRSGAALSNGPFGASSRPWTPPATFDSRLMPTNDLASQILWLFAWYPPRRVSIPGQHTGLSRVRPIGNCPCWSRLGVASVYLFLFCRSLDWVLLAPLVYLVRPLGDSFFVGSSGSNLKSH